MKRKFLYPIGGAFLLAAAVGGYELLAPEGKGPEGYRAPTFHGKSVEHRRREAPETLDVVGAIQDLGIDRLRPRASDFSWNVGEQEAEAGGGLDGFSVAYRVRVRAGRELRLVKDDDDILIRVGAGAYGAEAIQTVRVNDVHFEKVRGGYQRSVRKAIPGTDERMFMAEPLNAHDNEAGERLFNLLDPLVQRFASDVPVPGR